MQLYKHNTSRDGTHRQAGGRSVDAALLVEELTEFLQYSYSYTLYKEMVWLYLLQKHSIDILMIYVLGGVFL